VWAFQNWARWLSGTTGQYKSTRGGPSITCQWASFLKAFPHSLSSSRFDSSTARPSRRETRAQFSFVFIDKTPGRKDSRRPGHSLSYFLFLPLLSLAFPFLSPPTLISIRHADIDSATEKETRRCPSLHPGVCHHPPNPFKHAGPKSTNKAKILVVTGRW
jgi:hypothetical protein